jgi:hypothetical protein
MVPREWQEVLCFGRSQHDKQTRQKQNNPSSSHIDLIPLPQGVFPSTDRGTQKKNY